MDTEPFLAAQQQHQQPTQRDSSPFYSILNEPLPPTPNNLRPAGQQHLFLQPAADHNVVGPSDHYGVQQQQQQPVRFPSNGSKMQVPGQPAEATKVCVIVDSRTPIIVKIACPPAQVTLGHLKAALPSIDEPNYKYFFKSSDSEFGIVKEEIQEDEAKLPTYRNRIVAWIVTPNKPAAADSERAHSLAYSGALYHGAGDLPDELPDHGGRRPHHRHEHLQLAAANDQLDARTNSLLNTCSSDIDSSSYFTETEDDSLSCSNYSETTCDTFVSRARNNRSNRQQLPHNHQGYYNPQAGRRHNKHHSEQLSHYHTATTGTTTASSTRTPATNRTTTNLSASNSSSSSGSSSATYSDATAVQCVTVHLVLTSENFLGLHIYANTVNGLDEGIYVDGVTENSAVAVDGRIEAGDKLIQVNDVNLEELSNEEAVRVLKEAVIKRGSLKLVVAKFVENNRGQEMEGIIGPKDVIHPIDTAAWVAHAQAITIPTSNPLEHTCSVTSSPSFSSNAQDADCIRPASTGMLRMGSGLRLNKSTTDMKVIIDHMKVPECGLDIRDREWLKIHIAEAFLGSDLVAWLERNVYGFKNNRDAKKFASRMMKEGYIRDPLSKKSFSSKSYYTFVI